MAEPERVEIENVNCPGKTYRVQADKFAAMRAAILAVLPHEAPGLTPAEIRARTKDSLPQSLFPGGETAGWWIKTVQLDLEAKRIIARAAKPPVRLYRL